VFQALVLALEEAENFKVKASAAAALRAPPARPSYALSYPVVLRALVVALGVAEAAAEAAAKAAVGTAESTARTAQASREAGLSDLLQRQLWCTLVHVILLGTAHDLSSLKIFLETRAACIKTWLQQGSGGRGAGEDGEAGSDNELFVSATKCAKVRVQLCAASAALTQMLSATDDDNQPPQYVLPELGSTQAPASDDGPSLMVVGKACRLEQPEHSACGGEEVGGSSDEEL
jgi:hypothetical protein